MNDRRNYTIARTCSIGALVMALVAFSKVQQYGGSPETNHLAVRWFIMLMLAVVVGLIGAVSARYYKGQVTAGRLAAQAAAEALAAAGVPRSSGEAKPDGRSAGTDTTKQG